MRPRASYFTGSTTSTLNDPGSIGPRPRPLAGAGPNFAAAMKILSLVGSSHMLRDPTCVCRVWITLYLSGVSWWMTVSVPSAADANALEWAGS